MKKGLKAIITKCDGSVERFSFPKLRNCVAAGLQDSGLEERLAGPLAKAVEAHLREWTNSKLPSSDYLYKCVCAVLRETGMEPAADRLDRHRRMRRHKRKRLRVVGDGRAARPWRKAAICAALQRDFGVAPTVARFLAGRVEAHVLGMDVRVIACGYLDELLRREVYAWGLVDMKVDQLQQTMALDLAEEQRSRRK